MTVFAVIGIGPNELEIPLVLFPTKQKAEDFIGLFPSHDKYKGWLNEDFSEMDGPYRTYDNEPVELYSKLFKDGNYYPGCGSCHKLVIREVEFGLPMVGWDLD